MSSVLTQARLKTLASSPHLAKSWYYIAAVALSVCNQPNDVPLIFEYMMDQPEIKTGPKDNQLLVARQIRESLLKGAALGGLPKTINSLTQLKNVTPVDLRDTELQRDPQVSAPGASVGAEFFDQVYGKISKRVMGQMATAYPDLAYYALDHVYAPLLSYTGVLSPKDTSLVVIACLVPQDVNPQLKGHLKGAINNGATVDEVSSVREMSMLISSWCGITWKSPVAKL